MDQKEILRAYRGFLRVQSHRLVRRPDWLFPLAHSEPGVSPIHLKAEATRQKGEGPSLPWLRWVRDRDESLDCQRLPGEEHACAVFVGQSRWILTGEDGAFGFAEATVWDAATGREVSSVRDVQAPFAAANSSSLVACVDLQKCIHLTDIEAGADAKPFPPEPVSISGLAFSPEDGRLACVTRKRSGSAWEDSMPGRLVVWDLEEGLELWSLDCKESGYSCVAFSPDGSVIAIGSGRHVLLVDAGAGLEIQRLRGHTQDVSAVAFSPDGFLLATAGAGYNLDEGELQLWTLTSGEARRLGTPIENRSILSLAVSPTGRILATGDQGGRLDLLSTEIDGADTSVTETESSLHSLCFSPEGQGLVGAAGWDGVLHWLFPETGVEAKDPGTLWAHSDWVRQAAIDPTTGRAFSVSYYSLIVSDARSGRLLRQVGLEGTFVSLSLSPDGKTVACGGFDGVTCLVDTHKGEVVEVFDSEKGIVQTLAFNRDGSRLIAGSEERGLLCWARSNGWSMDWTFPGVSARSVAWSPDGERLLVGEEDGSVLLVDWAQDQVQPVTPAHQSSAFSVAWNGDGSRFVTAGWDGALHLFTRDIELLATLNGDWGVGLDYYGPPIAFSPDGRHFAWAAGKQLVRVSTKEGKLAGEFEAGSPIMALGWDGISRLWAVDSGAASGMKPVCYQLEHCFSG